MINWFINIQRLTRWMNQNVMKILINWFVNIQRLTRWMNQNVMKIK